MWVGVKLAAVSFAQDYAQATPKRKGYNHKHGLRKDSRKVHPE